MTPTDRERIAVITGGSSGIGLAVVSRLLARGYRVGFFGQNDIHVATAQARLAREFDRNTFFGQPADVTSPHDLEAFLTKIGDRFGPPDTLVCSAGISPKGPHGAIAFDRIPLSEWNNVMAVNLTGAMMCCQKVLPFMMQHRFGRIVFIGSLAGRTRPHIAGAAYSTSKAALSGLARSLVAAVAKTGVTVNTIAPGRIVTDMTGDARTPANRDALKRIPIGRLGHPNDIAAAVEFLVSPDAGFINGAIIDVNGGEFTPT